MCEVYAIINESGGMGKTTLCMWLAWEYAKRGDRVLIIDLDGQASNLTSAVGLDSRGNDMSTIAEVVNNGYDIRATILELDKNVNIIPANDNLTSNAIVDDINSIIRFREALEIIKTFYDKVFIDVSPDPGISHYMTYASADYIIIPAFAMPKMSNTIDGVCTKIKEIKNSSNPGIANPNLKVLGIFINFYSKKFSGMIDRLAEEAKNYGVELFSTTMCISTLIPTMFDKRKGITRLYPSSQISKNFKTLVNEVEEKKKERLMADSINKYTRPTDMVKPSHHFEGTPVMPTTRGVDTISKTTTSEGRKRKAGRPRKESIKVRYTLFLDPEVKERATKFAEKNNWTLSQLLEVITIQYLNSIG